MENEVVAQEVVANWEQLWDLLQELIVIEESPLRQVYHAITYPNGHYGNWDGEGFRFNLS